MQTSLCEKVHLRGQRFCAEAHLSEEEPRTELSPTLVGHYTGLDKQKNSVQIVNIFLPINFNISFGCSKEPSH